MLQADLTSALGEDEEITRGQVLDLSSILKAGQHDTEAGIQLIAISA